MVSKLLEVILTLFLLTGCNTTVIENLGDVVVDNSEAIIVAEFNSTNWGILNYSDDFWAGDFYTLYNNGVCKYYKMYNKSGKKDEIEFTIPEEELKSIVMELENNYNQTHRNAMDGTGWNFKIYGMDGAGDKISSGYIYGTDLEEIVNEINTYKK